MRWVLAVPGPAGGGAAPVVAVDVGVPDAGRASFRTELRLPALEREVVVVDAPDLARPRTAIDDRGVPARGFLELRGEGIWAELVCEVPGEHWSFGLEAFGLRVGDPSEQVGERVAVGYDLEWDAGHVAGEVLVGRTVTPVDAPGTFEILV